jgi:hypothetical protein
MFLEGQMKAYPTFFVVMHREIDAVLAKQIWNVFLELQNRKRQIRRIGWVKLCAKLEFHLSHPSLYNEVPERFGKMTVLDKP